MHKKELIKLFFKYFVFSGVFWAIFVGLEDIRLDRPFFSWRMLPPSIIYGVIMSSFFVYSKWRDMKKAALKEEV